MNDHAGGAVSEETEPARDDGRQVTVVLADCHEIVREGITAKFRERANISMVGQCSDGEAALETILARKPDIAILDLQMPRLSGLDVVRKVRFAQCPTKLIVLSVVRDEPTIRELFRSGGDGYVLKEGPATHLFDAIDTVAGGGKYLTPLLDRQIIESHGAKQDPLALLSKREYEVFAFLVDGMRPKDIAKVLAISPKTVDTYRANIMRKLEVEGIAGLVRFAIQRNLSSGVVPA
jgi:DNA-binding NarL/FixJ family response regulator